MKTKPTKTKRAHEVMGIANVALASGDWPKAFETLNTYLCKQRDPLAKSDALDDAEIEQFVKLLESKIDICSGDDEMKYVNVIALKAEIRKLASLRASLDAEAIRAKAIREVCEWLENEPFSDSVWPSIAKHFGINVGVQE